jgi:hypothetical protein
MGAEPYGLFSHGACHAQPARGQAGGKFLVLIDLDELAPGDDPFAGFDPHLLLSDDGLVCGRGWVGDEEGEPAGWTCDP